MDLRESLLAERERLVGDLAHIDALLASRGWAPEPKGAIASKPRSSDPFEIMKEVFGDGGPKGPPEPIAYMKEATAWIESCPRGLNLRIADFKAHLVKKFGEDRVNEQSMRGPITKLLKGGFVIEVVRPGIGKAPLIFRRPPIEVRDSA